MISSRAAISTTRHHPLRTPASVVPQGEGFNRNRRVNQIDRRQRPKPPNLPFALWLSARCGAKTRRGTPCQCPAMPNGRCRIHGGKSPGAPKGNRNALKHGRHTAEAIANRRKVALLRVARKLIRAADECGTPRSGGQRSRDSGPFWGEDMVRQASWRYLTGAPRTGTSLLRDEFRLERIPRFLK
jgi:hypothetical protein